MSKSSSHHHHHQGSSSSGHDRNATQHDLFGHVNNIDDEDDDDYEALINCTSSSSNNAAAAQRTSDSAASSICYGTNLFIESNLVREEGKPSGLKNIGNTCWFNSIIQAFFHLPYFRRLILTFKLDQAEIEKLDENVCSLA
jgi:ubiquitin C-terminal hydrolase